MNYIKDQLPAELSIDYEGDEEKMNIRFIKLNSAISKAFLRAIKMGASVQRKNVIEFIKLMTTIEHFDFKSQFAHSIFEALVKYSSPNLGQEFQIVTLMLTNEDIQTKYFALLFQCLGKNTEGEVNFSLCLLERLMYNTVQILEGNKKGPQISAPSIQNLLKISMSLARTRELLFLNSVDHCNFLKICATSLQIMRKYSSGDKTHLETYEQIWKTQISLCQSLQIQVTDCVFGILIELCNFNEPHIFQDIEHNQNFHFIVVCSSFLILKCPNINRFWHSFLSKRLNSKQDLKNFDQFSVVKSLTENLYSFNSTIEQIVQKLNITDNLILATNLMTVTSHIKSLQILQVEKMESNQNPSKQINLSQLVQLSFKALYNPAFHVQKADMFFQVLNEIKTIANKLSQNFYNNVNEYLPLLNLLPPLKIVIRKCKNFMELEEHVGTLIKFLMVFLNDDKESKCFEEFVILICEQLRVELESGSQAISMQKIKSCRKHVDIIITSCLSMMQAQAKRIKNMRSYIRCIETLIKINKQSPYMESFKYLQNLVSIIYARSNKFDPEVNQLMSKLIKQSVSEGQGKVQCFKSLYKLTVEHKRVFYLELLFDFAETHSKDEKIIRLMISNSSMIAQVCVSSPHYQNSQLRNLSYSLTCQAIKKDLKTSDFVVQQLHEIVSNMKYSPKIYQKIIRLIAKQRHNFNKIFDNEKISHLLFTNVINLLLNMIDGMNQSVEQNTSSKIEKTTIFQIIANEILRYVLLITASRNHKKLPFEQYSSIIEKIKNSIEGNRMRSFSKMHNFFKTLVTSYVWLEASGISLKGVEQRMVQIQNMKQLMRSETNEKSLKMVQMEQLLSAGYARKLFLHFGSTDQPQSHENK